MKSLVLLGDSLVARKHQDGVDALIPRITKAFPTAEVVSYAVGGANSRQALEATRSISLPSDSLVIISLGMNDAAPWKQVPMQEFVGNYEQLIKLCSGHMLVLITPNPVNTTKQQSPGRDNAIIKQYDEAVRALANEHNAKVVDLFQIIGEAMRISDCHVEDGVHLNDAGYALFFDALSPLIQHRARFHYSQKSPSADEPRSIRHTAD